MVFPKHGFVILMDQWKKIPAFCENSSITGLPLIWHHNRGLSIAYSSVLRVWLLQYRKTHRGNKVSLFFYKNKEKFPNIVNYFFFMYAFSHIYANCKCYTHGCFMKQILLGYYRKKVELTNNWFAGYHNVDKSGG